MKKIGINDIEELVFHTDEVLTQIRFNRRCFDNNGNERNFGEEEYLDFIRINPINTLVELESFTLEKIKEQYLQPYLAMAISLFRNGVDGMPYYVDTDVSDEYLIKLLAVRCKDVLRIFAIQKELKKENYVKKNILET